MSSFVSINCYGWSLQWMLPRARKTAITALRYHTGERSKAMMGPAQDDIQWNDHCFQIQLSFYPANKTTTTKKSWKRSMGPCHLHYWAIIFKGLQHSFKNSTLYRGQSSQQDQHRTIVSVQETKQKTIFINFRLQCKIHLFNLESSLKYDIHRN